jgi:tetratricopeptide (TPR) repeat protein
VITRVWDDQTVPGMPRLEPNVTRSPDALKAYLAAKTSMRRGQVDSAAAAIDRAIALDSTFALALVDAVGIRTWQLSMTGQPFVGFFELLNLAMQHDDSLSLRNQLRLQATLASVRTEGAAAADALRRIIEIDSTDLGAWSFLAYVRNVYGWQYGATVHDAKQAADRVVALDSSYVPGLVAQAWIRLSGGDTVDTRRNIERLSRADTTVPMARGTLRTLRMLRADDATFRRQAQQIAGSTSVDWITTLRYVRAFMPARAEALLEILRAKQEPGPALNAAIGEQARLRVAEGRTASADSLFRASENNDPALQANVQRLLAATALTGQGDPAVQRQAVDWLQRSVPSDSVLAFLNTKPVWWTGWLVAAYHAQSGDTLLARRYQRAFGTLPASGSPATYREALQGDIESRLAERRGDAAAALLEARRALELWSIHTENQTESMPEPGMRFHLASLLARTGAGREAEPLFRSLLPPTTWMGFLSARAALELGDLEAARGDATSAAHHYSFALRLWERGGPEAAVWRSQVESRLSRLVSRIQG